MLNVKGLSELLTQNADEKLCKRWWIMTPNGTLLAYSQPSIIRDLRRQAAMIALSWQEHEGGAVPESEDEEIEDLGPAAGKEHLKALTIETATSNLIATKLQKQLLLVLEGGVPPRRQGFEPKTTPEDADSHPYPPEDPNLANIAKDATVSSRASSTVSSAATGILRLERKKLDAMAEAIATEFDSAGFEMPEEGAPKFF